MSASFPASAALALALAGPSTGAGEASAAAEAATDPAAGASEAAVEGPQEDPVAAPAGPGKPGLRTVVVHGKRGEHDERASTVVSRRDMEERLPRSAPDALRYEPGVYVQQTAHSQGSPYVRGVTGQQTIMSFDGIRLNTSTFRQGPNQYFFTIDSRSVQRLEVVRGASSTRYGSDAIGGALLATPIEPSLAQGERRWTVHPKGSLRSATADGELGGRAQVEVGYRGRVGFIGGVGYRDVGLLRTGGPIRSPATGDLVKTPRFAPDGVTQLGTGFKELTADGRLVWAATDRLRLTLGYYDYRQYDAPRTDRCPPATAPESECLIYDQQFRTMVYGALAAEPGFALADRLRWTLSFQKQHERRRLDRPTTQTQNRGLDDVYTVGTGVVVDTAKARPRPWLELGGRYGADAYFDTIRSSAANVYTAVAITSPQSRGQYLDGARYLTSGTWLEGQATFAERLELRAGGRLALVSAAAEGDVASTSSPVHHTWVAPVGSTGAVLHANEWLRWLVNLDQGFRAPNLDDLTSRQQTGPGFQLENAELHPERALSLETGVKIELPWIEAAFFAYNTRITDLIARAPRQTSECPGGSDGCAASQTVFQLVNLDGVAVIRGVDGVIRLLLPAGFGLRTTLAYTWGEGPTPVIGGSPSRLPLSRIPPLNGAGELTWRSRRLGFFAGAALRWAAAQTRLAIADMSDVRIPKGGTPGFIVADLRAGYRWRPRALLSLVFENITNEAYRYHGSSVNGPGRGLQIYAEFGF